MNDWMLPKEFMMRYGWENKGEQYHTWRSMGGHTSTGVGKYYEPSDIERYNNISQEHYDQVQDGTATSELHDLLLDHELEVINRILHEKFNSKYECIGIDSSRSKAKVIISCSEHFGYPNGCNEITIINFSTLMNQDMLDCCFKDWNKKELVTRHFNRFYKFFNIIYPSIAYSDLKNTHWHDDGDFLLECPIHDGEMINISDITPYDIGCSQCARDYFIENKIWSYHNSLLIEQEYENAPLSKDYSCTYMVGFYCEKHGDYSVLFSKAKRGLFKCPKCANESRGRDEFGKKISKGEGFVAKTLGGRKINYIREVRFEDCRNKYPLSFDFYLPKHKAVIEYHGKQHYKPIKYFGGKKSFKMNKKRDKIKKEYCIKNKIRFIEIPYTYDSYEKVEKFLHKRL